MLPGWPKVLRMECAVSVWHVFGTSFDQHRALYRAVSSALSALSHVRSMCSARSR